VTARVQRLDALTASRIAAGEVIERPLSVVKELMDNALDAGSTRIDVAVYNGGRRLIQVSDNGSGMSPDQAMLALQRFTTSKIRCLDDLRTLTTLGFRGEALPSIAAVAEIEIYTRPVEDAEGALIHSLPGRDPTSTPVGCPVGTRVCVHHLFAQIPVRLRGLKSVSREVQLLHELVGQYALAHPLVTFQVQHDGRRLLFAPACTDLRQRVPVVFGRALAQQLLPVSWRSVDIDVHGVVSTPSMTRATRQRQYFWVNGRPIRHGLLSVAVERAYGGLLPPGRHPIVALGVRIAPDLLDVNMHPRKTEIKFLHERAVFATVQEAVEAILQQYPADPEVWPQADVPTAWADMGEPTINESTPRYTLPPPRMSPASLHSLGQVANTFVVASGADGLCLLDQHAAHEALIYERLVTAQEAGVELDEPFLLHLPASQREWLTGIVPALTALAFRLEAFGKDRMLVHVVPPVLQALVGPGTFFDALLEAKQRLTARSSPEDMREQLSAAFACRTAVRAGDHLSAEQMAMLVEALAEQRLPYNCPHGRPTHVTLSLADLERRFLRFFPLDTSAGGC
jgi:DNA mismatch repair protein MutL